MVALSCGVAAKQLHSQEQRAPEHEQPQANQPAAEQARSPPPSEQPQAVAVAEQQKPDTGPYDPRCAEPKSRDDADLCEQRRMAKAAEDAVWWARLQSLIGLFGFGAVLLSLIFSWWAAVAAARSAIAAKVSAEAIVAGQIIFTNTFETIHVTGFAYAVYFSPTGESTCFAYPQPAYWKYEKRASDQSQT